MIFIPQQRNAPTSAVCWSLGKTSQPESPQVGSGGSVQVLELGFLDAEHVTGGSRDYLVNSSTPVWAVQPPDVPADNVEVVI